MITEVVVALLMFVNGVIKNKKAYDRKKIHMEVYTRSS